MDINIEISEKDLKRLVVAHLQSQLGDLSVAVENVKIQVKSKQNFKSEWEEASFRATYHKNTAF